MIFFTHLFNFIFLGKSNWIVTILTPALDFSTDVRTAHALNNWLTALICITCTGLVLYVFCLCPDWCSVCLRYLSAWRNTSVCLIYRTRCFWGQVFIRLFSLFLIELSAGSYRTTFGDMLLWGLCKWSGGPRDAGWCLGGKLPIGTAMTCMGQSLLGLHIVCIYTEVGLWKRKVVACSIH